MTERRTKMAVTTMQDSVDTANDQMDLDLNSFPWRLEIVPISDIYVDRFQRPVSDRWLAERDGKLNPALLGTVTLSERERRGKNYSAVDGQHRIELCKRAGMESVAAVVFYDLTVEQEAALFRMFQEQRRNTTPLQRFISDLIAGDESETGPRAKAMKKIAAEEGYEFSESEGPGKLKAVRSCEIIYDEDPALLRLVLRLIRRSWGDLPFAANDRMIKGIFYFVRGEEDLDEDRFVDRLSNVTPTAISQRAQSLRDGRGLSGALPRFISEAVENEYRSRKRR